MINQGGIVISNLQHIKYAAAQWETKLGQQSLDCLCAYSTGFDHALNILERQPLEPYSQEQRNIWLQHQVNMTSEHQSRLNAFNWLSFQSLANLWSKNQQDAINIYISLRTRALRECPLVKVPPPIGRPLHSDELEEYKGITIIEAPRNFEQLLDQACKRPAMFFGNQYSLTCLWAMLNGYFDAHTQCNVECLEKIRFVRFQLWMNKRYPFAETATWAKTISVLGINCNEWAFESFQTHWRMFIDGENSQAQDPTMRKIVETMIASVDVSQEE